MIQRFNLLVSHMIRKVSEPGGVSIQTVRFVVVRSLLRYTSVLKH